MEITSYEGRKREEEPTNTIQLTKGNFLLPRVVE